MESSLLVPWGPANEIGISIIDEQHRGIVSIINSFGFFIQRDQNAEFYLNSIFTMIDCYTKLHFATEEEFLRSVGYPETESHQLLHRNMIRQSFSVAGKSVRLRDPDIYLQFLKEWWIGHINKCDRIYAQIIEKSRCAAGAAE